ncbi:MAG: hypothetical protein ACRDHG_04890, partial [Anaerolineales bacterium]
MRAKVAALSLNPLSTPSLLIASLVVGALSARHYFREGYGLTVVLIWLITIAVAGYAAHRADGDLPAPALIERSEWGKALLLLVALSPLYLAFIRTIPYQISTDEVTVMMNEAEASARLGWDIFSISGYFGFPSFIFVVYGWLGRLFGGIDLGNMRTIDGLVGLASIALFYLLAVPLLTRRTALAAALLLGTNHALLAISRVAMRNNSALLVMLCGLLFLLN